MKKVINSRLIMMWFVCTIIFPTIAQIQNPVQLTTLLTPPYSPFFTDLYKIGGKGLISSIVFKDFTEPSWDVKIKIKIEGNNGLILETKSVASLSPITIYPGVPLVLQGDDWAQMLDYSNLNISGTDSRVLTTRGVLPEGFYSFCVEVIDARSGKLLSNASCASGQFILGGIPQLISPRGNYILPSIPQNIIFQWIMTAPPYDPQNTEYSLRLYEITTEGVDPAAAISSENALKMYESEFSPNLQFNYDASATNLEIGKRYVCQVKVQDKEGKAMFRNEGLSEPGWFMYGYPIGGKITLEKPFDGSQFGPKDLQSFKWALPDNKAAPSQQITYKFKVVKIKASDTTNLDEAYKNKEVVYEEETRPSASNSGWETIIREDLEKDSWFAWKVQAFSGEQMVAESKIQKFKSRPLLEKFFAGDNEVLVLSTTNNDLSKLSGKGQIKLDKKGEKLVEVDFKDITIKKLAENVFALEKGELFKELKGADKMEVTPKLKENGMAYFTPNAVKLDKNMLRIRGKMEIPLDIVLDGEAARMTSNNTWVDFNIFKLTGGVKMSGKYDLMEPLNFTINLDTNTTMIMGLNGYELLYYGNIALPENSQNAEGKRIVLPFVNLTSLSYIELESERDRLIITPYRPVPNTNLLIYPKKFVIDFSEKKSPANFPKDWKGAYIPVFDLTFKQDFDAKKRITFKEEFTEKIDLTSKPDMKNWFQATGLFFNYKKELNSLTETKFNTFQTTPKLFEVNVEAGIVKNGVFKGSISIPVVDDNKKFNVYAAINSEGFLDGLLETSLNGIECVFAKENPESKATLKIKRAVFSGNNNLDMTVDVAIPKIKIFAPNVPGFKAFGNFQIGFNKPNGSTSFGDQVVGNYDNTVEITIDTFGLTYLNNKYLYYATSGLNISDDVKGIGGTALRINMFGSKEVSESLNIPNDYNNKPTTPISSATLNVKPEKLKLVDTMFVELDCGIAFMKGKLYISKGDPKWGTVFKGKIDGFIFAPSKIKAGSEIIIGTAPDKTKYWFFEAYATDDGVGVPLIPEVINIVGIEGKVYKNMSFRMDKKTKTGTIEIDKKIKYGAALYMQLIDAQAKGTYLKADVGVEIKFMDKDFEIAMQAEGTMLNASGRTAAPAAATEAITKPLAEKVVGQTIEEINKQEVKINDWIFKPNIQKDLSAGGLSGRNGSTAISFGANVVQKFGYFNFKNDDYEIKLAGNSGKKSFAFDISKFGSNAFGMGLSYFPGDSASVRYAQGTTFGITGGVNMRKKLGQFSVNYQASRFSVMSNKAENSAQIELVPSSDFKLTAGLNRAKQSGEFELKTDGHLIGLVAKKSGYVSLKVDNNLAVLFDKEKKDGKVELKLNGNQILLAGNPQGGQFKFQNTAYLFDAGLTSTDGKGWMKFSQGTEREYMFDLDTKNQAGMINIQEADKKFGLGAGKGEGSAFFNMEIPNLKLQADANVKDNSGLFSLEQKGEKYMASLNSDSAVFLLDKSDLKMKVAGYKDKSGLIGFSNSDLSLYVQGSEEGKGSLRFINNTLNIFAAADKTQEMGKFSFKYQGNDSLNLFVNNKIGKASFAGLFGNRFVSGNLDKAGKGAISMDMSEFKVTLAGDKAGYGKIYFNREQDKFLLDVEADKSTMAGKSRFVIGNDSVNGNFNLNSGLASLQSSVQGTQVNGDIDAKGIANALVKNADLELKSSVNPSGINTFYFKNTSLTLDGFGDKPNLNARIGMKMANDSISAFFNKKEQTSKLNATFADVSFGANVANKDGNGEMYYNDAERKITVLGDKAGKGKVAYKDPSANFLLFADKKSGDAALQLAIASDSVIASIKQKDKFSGLIKIDGIKSAFNISKTGDKTVSYVDSENKFAVAANADKTIFLDSKIKNIEVYAQIFADGKKVIRYKNNNDTINGSIAANGDKVISAFLDNNLLQTKIITGGEKSIRFLSGSTDFTASKTASNSVIDYVFGNKRFKVDKETLLYKSAAHEVILLNQKNTRLFIDGREITPLKPNFDFSIDGISFTYVLDADLRFLRCNMPGFPSLDIGYNKLNFPYLNAKLPNFDLKFNGIDLGYDFSFNGLELSFPSLDFISFKLPSGLSLNFKGFDLGFDLGELKWGFTGKYAFNINFKSLNYDIDLDKMNLSMKGYALSLDKLKNIKLQLPNASNWLTYNFDSELIGFNYDKFKFNYEPLKLLSFTYDAKIFKLFDTGMELGWDNKILAFEIDKYLKFNFDATKYFNITPLNLSTNWDKINLGLSMDSLRFSFLPIKLNIDPKSLNLDFDGKLLSLDIDKNLKFTYMKGKLFHISPVSFKVDWDKYGVSFGKIDPLSFTDGIRSFKISGDFLSLSDVDLDLKYNFDKDLLFKYKLDQFSVSLDNISCKIGKYNLGFGKLNGLYFNYEKYNFTFKDILSLNIDGRLLSYNLKSPRIELSVPDLKFGFSGWLDKINFNYADYNLSLGKIDGLKYWDKINTFQFGDDLLIKTGLADFSLGIKGLKLPTKSFYFNYKEYNLSYAGPKGIKFAMPDKWFSLGGQNMYFGLGWGDLDINVGEDYMKLFKSDYGVTYGGGDQLFGITYKKSVLALKENYTMSMLDDGKGVEIDGDGIITLINNGQKIIAGGDQPIRFSDPSGMDMKDGGSETGFKFNVAGMDFDVNATEDNNVVIKTNQRFGTVAIESQGEGLMTAALTADGTHYGTLYKNPYTWGLALGNSKVDMLGPKAEQNIAMDGPQKIGKITANSTSIIQVIFYASYSSKTGEFVMRGQATGTAPLLCMTNVKLDAKFSKNDWFIKIAEKDKAKWASIKPLCFGMETKGYLYVTGKEISAGAALRYDFDISSGEVDLGLFAGSANAWFFFEMGGEGTIVLKPSFAIPEIALWVEAGAGVKVCGKVGPSVLRVDIGCRKLFEVGISGRLALRMTDNDKSVSGKLKANVEVAGEDFDVEFKSKFNL